jgi:hypothetical protein
MTSAELTAALAAAVDPQLAEQLIDEAVSLEEAFLLRKWKYSELDGGRFTEVAARLVYSIDSSNLSRTRSFDDCAKYVENDQVQHAFPERQAAIHIMKVLRAIYKLRSQRGAVHVSPTYTANEIDSRLIVECSDDSRVGALPTAHYPPVPEHTLYFNRSRLRRKRKSWPTS